MRRNKQTNKKDPFATTTERKAQAVEEVAGDPILSGLIETKGEISKRKDKTECQILQNSKKMKVERSSLNSACCRRS